MLWDCIVDDMSQFWLIDNVIGFILQIIVFAAEVYAHVVNVSLQRTATWYYDLLNVYSFQVFYLCIFVSEFTLLLINLQNKQVAEVEDILETVLLIYSMIYMLELWKPVRFIVSCGAPIIYILDEQLKHI